MDPLSWIRVCRYTSWVGEKLFGDPGTVNEISLATISAL
jgi:hypothetical protein